MGKFEVKNKVISVETNEHGEISEVFPPRRGRQLYAVRWDSGKTTDELEDDLLLDCDISDPFERCKKGIFGSYAEFSKKNTTFKIRSSNNSTISSLKASKTLFRAYQFKPLLKFLNSSNRRLLVADEVGLGKTIEAGHIMLELKARKELHNVMIVCPRSLQKKWQEELLVRFDLNFKVYENSKDLLQDLEDNSRPTRAIVNYEKIRLAKVKKEEKKDSTRIVLPEAKKNSDSKKNLADFLTDNPYWFSLVVCDEAHRMRNSETQTYKGAEILMSHARTALFLTATPVMISQENLYNLLHLLDNTRYFNYQIFLNRLEENRPFVQALTELNHMVAFPMILEKLRNESIRSRYFSNDVELYSEVHSVDEIYKDDPVYQEIIHILKGEDSKSKRARLQYLMSSMSVMNSVFSRTRKREVATDMSQAERKPHLCKVELTSEEQEEFDRVIDEYTDDNSYTTWWGEEQLTFGGMLGLVQKKRQVASSVWAYLSKDSDLDNGIDAYENEIDSKFETLKSIINEVFAHNSTKKLIVFALFRKTLKYLQLRLERIGIKSYVIHGLVDDRYEILQQFKQSKSPAVLLSSEVGSEGLDMQFCNSMVNYDLPWNPMVVEQRIGRIDRFGQKSPVVNIYNLVVAGSIQEDIYERLLKRIGIFRETVGDMEAILDATLESSGGITIQDAYSKLEKDLYTSRLSDEERKKRIAEIELAIEHERESIERLQDGLSNALTNDAYFKDEINRILNNNAYVTENEIQNYLEQTIRAELTTCELVEKEKDIYEFRLPMANKRLLRNFLTQYQPMGEENERIFFRFNRELEEENALTLTFSQQCAYENRKLMYLNIYHPIIQACVEYFSKKEDKTKTTFSYSLPSDELLVSGKKYYLALYQFTTQRKVQGQSKCIANLFPVLFDLEARKSVEDVTLVDRVFGRSQTSGKEHNPTNADIADDVIYDMHYDFNDAVKTEKKRRLQEMRVQMESDRRRNEQQTREYYKTMIDNREQDIRKWELHSEIYYDDEKELHRAQSAIRFAESAIETYEREMKQKIEDINEVNDIVIDEELLSLNLVTII